MFFYYTQKVDNHYKVGISRSYDGIKNRLSDYRQIQPGINIKFFTEIPSSSIENTFKNKFGDYRIGSSECYKLKIDIIFQHVLKFIHGHRCLFGYWGFSGYYLSEYYFNKEAFYRYLNHPNHSESYSFATNDGINDSYRKSNFVMVAKTFIDSYKKTSKPIITKTGKKKYIIQKPNFETREKMNNFYQKNNDLFSSKHYYHKDLKYRREQYDIARKFYNSNFSEKLTKYTEYSGEVEKFVENSFFKDIKKYSPEKLKGYINPKSIDTNQSFSFKRADRDIGYMKSYSYSKKIKASFTADYYNLKEKLRRETEKKTYLNNKDDFVQYYTEILDSVQKFSIFSSPEPQKEYLRKVKNILRKHFESIHQELSNIPFEKRINKESKNNESQKFNFFNSEMFIKSVKVLISPDEKGFVMGMMDHGLEKFKEEEKKLCLNIARGMIEHARNNPHELYVKGEKKLEQEATKNKIPDHSQNVSDKKIIQFPKKK